MHSSSYQSPAFACVLEAGLSPGIICCWHRLSEMTHADSRGKTELIEAILGDLDQGKYIYRRICFIHFTFERLKTTLFLYLTMNLRGNHKYLMLRFSS